MFDKNLQRNDAWYFLNCDVSLEMENIEAIFRTKRNMTQCEFSSQFNYQESSSSAIKKTAPATFCAPTNSIT